jgi:hypothetical protein
MQYPVAGFIKLYAGLTRLSGCRRIISLDPGSVHVKDPPQFDLVDRWQILSYLVERGLHGPRASVWRAPTPLAAAAPAVVSAPDDNALDRLGRSQPGVAVAREISVSSAAQGFAGP